MIIKTAIISKYFLVMYLHNVISKLKITSNQGRRKVSNIGVANFYNHKILVWQNGIFTTIIQKYWCGSCPFSLFVLTPLLIYFSQFKTFFLNQASVLKWVKLLQIWAYWYIKSKYPNNFSFLIKSCK